MTFDGKPLDGVFVMHSIQGTSEKSVTGNKLGNLAVFLRFSSIADLQSHRLHHLKIPKNLS